MALRLLLESSPDGEILVSIDATADHAPFIV
jgi:hypothetical protein